MAGNVSYRQATLQAMNTRRCCPDCTPGCQMTGLAVGQFGDFGDGWAGAPFDDGGINAQASVFWGDGCCPDCPRCQICQN